ncbi:MULTISPECIES: flagellar basal body-associated FliL family protein [Rhodanobacter]|uniref:flagellar basal body-associated FliL family protein n=2 Tax=Rhodanobacteraceae TaxID=1775411 RepID=UPI001F2EACB3|nr:flagellar basal body-associated FliL family protein [Rhodanobacter thiooxydans]UJJ54259.1 flagellar basal body-associated FliL family protein [Rhodanobacter thiooxydans]
MSFNHLWIEVFMVDEEQAGEVVDTPPERKSRKPLVIAVSVVLLLALGIGGYVWRSRQSVPGKAGKSTPKVAQAELYLPLDPAFVVNFRDAESLRYLQVGVTLMSHDPAAIEVAKGADPVIRDALVALFSNQDFAIISDTAGRQKVQADALVAVRKIVRARLGRPGIDALYFTSFVMQ